MSEENKIEIQTKEKRKAPLIFWAVIIIFTSAVFGALFGFMSGSSVTKGTPKFLEKNFLFLGREAADDKARKDIVKQRVIEEDSAVIEVVEKSSPAVVSIVVSKDIPKMRNFFFDPFSDFPEFFGTPLPQQRNGQGGTEKQKIGGGSGFFISADGMVVTNKHVVEDAEADYTVITNDDKEHAAKVLAKDPTNDIAVVKIEGGGYPTLPLGESGAVKIGQTVIAIGNSLGEFSNTVSKGIVSGLRRNLTASGGLGRSERLSNIIQTDAAINPGNSGGPLLNLNGEVIGINVAMASGAENIGFAIPADQIRRVVDQVQKTGKITTPYLGIRYVPVGKNIQRETDIPYDYGVLVARGERLTDFAVVPGSPADKAGIVENDIILELDGTKINKDNELAFLIAKHNVGDDVVLRIWHKGEVKEIKVKLEERK